MGEWNDAEHHVERAHAFFEAGHWDEAESELRYALSIDPHQPEWHFNLGLTLDAAGRHADARRAFIRSHELSPDHSAAPLMVGMMHTREGNDAASISWFEKAASIVPDDPTPLVQHIAALTRLGEHDKAEVVYYLAQQTCDDSADLHAAIAESLIARGLPERAIWCLREAGKIDPRLPGVWSRLAEVFASTGRLERARQLFLKEVRTHPGKIEAMIGLGKVLRELGRVTEADEKFRQVLELVPDHLEAHDLLASLALHVGNNERAIEFFDVLVKLDPEVFGVRRRLGEILLKRNAQGDLQRARELLLAEHTLMRNQPQLFSDEAVEHLSGLLMDAGLAAEAVRAAKVNLERRPGAAQAMHLLSAACFQAGDDERASDAARRALRLAPTMVGPMYNLALSSIRQKQWNRARYWVRQARQVDPDDATVRRLRLMLIMHTGLEVMTGIGHVCRRLVTRTRVS
ncbi:MAG: tetratricopeptide repeat protein [Phycisphaeraceae bacterium]|nr:tetratricopeptide repeat protein [Phycisphaerales bacterium]MCB9861145.1 tetratricopeptide repeat protein [Phycisphaeraceae bacterium]